MLIVMKPGSAREQTDRVLRLIAELDLRGDAVVVGERVAIGVCGGGPPPDPSRFERLPGVDRVLQLSGPLRLVSRQCKPEDTVIQIGPARIGGGEFAVIAGPCAVEDEDQILSVARAIKVQGADLLRGGAYKPRTSPYSFQGLGERGLELLARAREETGLPVVTEAIDEASLERVEQYADVVQIGARNMQNFSLLRRVGRCRLPVLLKRGMSSRLEDFLLAAEYILNAGNDRVILCERGIRTFADHGRYTLDLSVVPAVHQTSHLPIVIDPSHGTGVREFVAPLARAALAAGADGVMLEVHPQPSRALCDGPQAIVPEEFASLVADLRALAPLVSRRTETVS